MESIATPARSDCQLPVNGCHEEMGEEVEDSTLRLTRPSHPCIPPSTHLQLLNFTWCQS